MRKLSAAKLSCSSKKAEAKLKLFNSSLFQNEKFIFQSSCNK